MKLESLLCAGNQIAVLWDVALPDQQEVTDLLAGSYDATLLKGVPFSRVDVQALLLNEYEFRGSLLLCAHSRGRSRPSLSPECPWLCVKCRPGGPRSPVALGVIKLGRFCHTGPFSVARCCCCSVSNPGASPSAVKGWLSSHKSEAMDVQRSLLLAVAQTGFEFSPPHVRYQQSSHTTMGKALEIMRTSFP